MQLRKALLQFVAYLAVLFVLLGVQTAFWPDFFPSLPAPLLWLATLLYLAFYRDTNVGFISVYLLAVVLSLFTLTPFGILVFVATLVFFGARVLRSRFFWPNRAYFTAVTAANVFFVFLIHFVVSFFLEDNPIFDFPILRLLGETATTALAAAALYGVFRRIDRLLEIEVMPEGELLHE